MIATTGPVLDLAVADTHEPLNNRLARLELGLDRGPVANLALLCLEAAEGQGTQHRRLDASNRNSWLMIDHRSECGC